ncbi:hypothetical protein TI04_09725 [Achromatium sp. WMS2]|nr:hypothetical protein TI04_09725 [Achromatium sp. WMS2]
MNDIQDLVFQFLEDGFCVTQVPGIAEIRPKLLNAFSELIRDAEELGSKGCVKIRKSDLVTTSGHGWSWGCDHIHSPELRRQCLLDVVSFAPIPTIITHILGSRVRFCGAHGHWSPTFYDYYLHWHRDTRPEHWEKGNPDNRSHVQVIIALEEESVVWIVPASHLRNLIPLEKKFITTNKHDPHPDQVIPRVPAGYALLLNTYTLHRAQCSSFRIRRALHFGFSRVGSKHEPGRKIKAWAWLKDVEFLSKQTDFLREAILEEICEAADQGRYDRECI